MFNLTTPITGDIILYAKWTANTNTAYKVEHYQQNVGGTGYVLESTENKTGTTDTLATATPKSYTGFTQNTSHPDSVPSGNINGDGSLVLKLYYVRNVYTVSFDSNGGSAVDNQTKVYGATVTKPADPTLTGYTFGGWYSDPSFTNAWNFETDTVGAGDMTLYAKWTINQYTVTFDSNGGSAVLSQTVTYNATATEPQPPTKAGYAFDGWYSDSELTTKFDFSTPIMGDITLYAKWTSNPTPGGAGGGSTDTPKPPEKTITVTETSSKVFENAPGPITAEANMENAFATSVEVRVTDTYEDEAGFGFATADEVYPFDISLYIKGTNQKTKPAPGYW